MASYWFKMFMGLGKTPEDPIKEGEVNNNPAKNGNENVYETICKIGSDTEGNLIQQERIAKELPKSLDWEIAKSGVAVGNLKNINRTAGGDVSDLFERTKYSETELRKQIDLITMELIKLEKHSERHDLKLTEIKQKFYLLQEVINQAKEAHEQVDVFVRKNLPI